MVPTKDYISKDHIAMLDIEAIVSKWQEKELSDYKALLEIDKINVARQKERWNENHQ